MVDQKLGYCGNSVWIRFSGSVHEFPLDVQISDCVLYHLERNDWSYLDGNGCGTTLKSRILLRAANALFNIDLTPVCNLHDLEYSLDLTVDKSGCLKSVKHKLFADAALEYNILEFARRQKDVRCGLSTLAFIYMVSVRLFGHVSYWRNIPKNKRM